MMGHKLKHLIISTSLLALYRDLQQHKHIPIVKKESLHVRRGLLIVSSIMYANTSSTRIWCTAPVSSGYPPHCCPRCCFRWEQTYIGAGHDWTISQPSKRYNTKRWCRKKKLWRLTFEDLADIVPFLSIGSIYWIFVCSLGKGLIRDYVGCVVFDSTETRT